jgi:hypothetical protein
MKRPNEVDLAWDLVDVHRNELTQAQCDMAFVNLGAAEYTTVIRDVLTAVLQSGLPLSADYTEKVEGWVDFYSQQAEFQPLLDRVPGT